RKPPRRRRSLTRQGKRKAAPDLVHRHFDAVSPNVLRVGGMTEIETGEGKLYLATVIGLFSRRLLGYAMGAHHDAALVAASLKTAATTRGGDVDGVIFHSDRGSEGGFNRSSQHLHDLGGCCGTGTSSCSTSGRPSTVAVAGAPTGEPDAREAAVLAKDRRGAVQRGRRRRLRSVAAAWAAVVS
ncbi:DDE-type integrase/transposase/recombinase, partial [Streptomyces sp. AVP053U2]|uniref:DDE-type integrase/transposase/recombinase n=1 Tax=Streptomyces sp. AVP053U2 TaxID=1737066 RepID=UPI00114CF407